MGIKYQEAKILSTKTYYTYQEERNPPFIKLRMTHGVF